MDETIERFPHKTYRGSDELAADIAESYAAVADRRIELISVADQGDDVFVHWKMTGIHRGRFRGMEPTGKPLFIDGIDHFVVRDGKVVSNGAQHEQCCLIQSVFLRLAERSRSDNRVRLALVSTFVIAHYPGSTGPWPLPLGGIVGDRGGKVL